MLSTYMAHLYCKRRRFLENHPELDYDKWRDEPHKVYLLKLFGKPLLKEVEDDWLYSEFDWLRFSRYCSWNEWKNDAQKRKTKSDFRSFISFWFGKDWIYYIWMSFGEVTNDMLECLSDTCMTRALRRTAIRTQHRRGSRRRG